MEASYDLIAELPLRVEGYNLVGLELDFGGHFVRTTTLVHLRGEGFTGIGEDVVYDALDHVAFQNAAATLPLAGTWTLDSFSRHLDALDLFPAPPVREVSRHYRRWAFESAALDLALQQAGRPLAAQLEREPEPVTYVVSMRLAPPGSEEPETSQRLRRLLERYPNTRFKLDPTNTWSEALIDELAATGRVDSLDLKGQYKGTPVDVRTDAELYRRVACAFPAAWLEDPDLNEQTWPVLEGHRDRITWDAVIHSVEDIRALPFPPRMVNIKPSRFGPLRSLLAAYDYCRGQGIGAYGGGQTELGVGRDHIQYLAALFHPDAPNDVAPREFNLPEVPAGLPPSPLALSLGPSGFRFARSLSR